MWNIPRFEVQLSGRSLVRLERALQRHQKHRRGCEPITTD